MEIKTKSSRMHSIVVLFDMHTKFFLQAIDGISDKDAHERKDTKANHIAWIAGSQVSERFDLAGLLGKNLDNTTGELFKNHKGIQDGATYPSLAEYKTEFEKISPVLRESFLNITDEKLDSIFEMPGMPDVKMSHFDLISFMTYREASCIGQIILWRRLLGYPGIKYD